MNKSNLNLVALLLAVTGLLAALRLGTRADVAPGSLPVAFGGVEQALSVESLPMTPVEGAVVNGKGEEKAIHADGIELKDVLARAGIETYEKVTVTASDAYAATLTAEELKEPGKVWLIRREDSLQLIVFGDPNAKRNVRNVERVDAE